jgi:MerR family mercuric resistance operon transcriptional regulator
VAALRYYEQVGLLVPSSRTEADYREYSSDAVERVRFIVQAQERGFALREIQTVLTLYGKGQTPCPSVAQAARHKVERLDKQIAQLHKRRDLLAEAVRLWESGLLVDAPICPMLNVSESDKGGH